MFWLKNDFLEDKSESYFDINSDKSVLLDFSTKKFPLI